MDQTECKSSMQTHKPSRCHRKGTSTLIVKCKNYPKCNAHATCISSRGDVKLQGVMKQRIVKCKRQMTHHQPGMLGCVMTKPANKWKREYM